MNKAHVKTQLRETFRARRQALPMSRQQTNAALIAEHVLALPAYQAARQLGVYLKHGAEVDPQPIVEHAWAQGKQCYLPQLDHPTKNSLRFLQYTPETTLLRNRYGIPEPQAEEAAEIALAQLELLLIPLVAFDDRGHRLGMGAGFYDRTLAELGEKPAPLLLGLAHSVQHSEALPVEPWDVGLSGVVTELGILTF